MSASAVRVSVIVPVFEPGPGFDDLIRSLDRQTLATGEFEVLLCDDGSGDPTRTRLEQVAAARPNVRVLTLPHTGWPGTPRNHGIDAARGTYLFFADQDDRLFENGLRAMCDYADHHGSDVVVGKVVGVGRSIPRQIFRRDVTHATLGEDPLLALLTPHKLFRTRFIRENEIRFPDGQVRLEDHLFVMQAYFRARTISILASTECYAWLKNKGSASSSRIDPETYFPHLEAVLDLVEANTEPGKLRDELLRHWYRGKILGRLAPRRLLRYPETYRETFLDVVTPIAQNRFTAGVENGLPLPLRIRSSLLRAGRRGDLVRLAQYEEELECRAELATARWTRTGRLELTLDLRFVHEGQDALVVDQAYRLEPPPAWSPDTVPPPVREARKDLEKDRVELFLREDDGQRRRIPGHITSSASPARIVVDPVAAFGRSDSSSGGVLMVRARRLGWTFETEVGGGRSAVPGASPVLAGRRVRLVRRHDGSLELRREWPSGRVRDLTARAVRKARRAARAARRRA